MMQSIFEDLPSAGTNTVRSLINTSAINYLKNFSFPKQIDMKGTDHSIFINDETSYVNTPLDCDYSSPETNQWSLIAIYHQNIGFKVDEIMNALFEIAGDNFFLPITFRRSKSIDYFLIRNQNDALRELLKHKLQLQVNGWKLPMIVKLEVSSCTELQIRPKKNVAFYLQRKVRESTSFGMLDLSNFSKEPEFCDMIISLRNKGVSNMFFDVINGMKSIKTSSNIRMLKLSNNQIATLENFRKLYDFKNIEVLDLSSNNIMNIKEINHLKDLKLKQLIITDNPCNNYPNLESQVQNMLPLLQNFNLKLLFRTQMEPDVVVPNGNREIANVDEGILIKPTNCNSYKNRFDKLINENYWSKVILYHNKTYTAREIMDELSKNLLTDVNFYPCYFQRIDNRDEFFLYRNVDALKKFLISGLKLQFLNRPFPVDINIRINVAEFKDGEVLWSTKIKHALIKRIKDNILDLNDFPKDPEFEKVILSMNSNSTMDFILTHAKAICPNIIKINAENCNIISCKGFEDNLFTFSKLYSLNLRNNNIKNLNDFVKTGSILEIFLDGNPVCNFPIFQYIKHVRGHFKHLEWLDGYKVFDKICLVTYQNYLVSTKLERIVSEFVAYFYKLWDSYERLKLPKLLYNQSSMFTLSFHYEYDENLTKLPWAKMYPRFQNIIKFNRNIAKNSNMSLNATNVFIGRDIEMVFGELCKTKHNLNMMTVDAPYFNEKEDKIGITVSGTLEEFAHETDNTPLVFGFSRTFLIKLVDGRFLITNDQLLLREPTVVQYEQLEKRIETATQAEINEQCRNLLPTEFEEKSLRVAIVQNLTKCSLKYCKNLLKDSGWDLKKALTSFNCALERNEIPDDQFKFI